MKKVITLLLPLLGLLVLDEHANAAPSAQRVMSRAIKNLRVPSEESKIQMILVNGRGQRRTRVVTVSAATTGGHDRSVARFSYPGGIRGTALLSREDDDRKDIQWLFMPVLGRTRRVATTQLGDSFMGSELAYEDIKSLRLEDWRFEMLRQESYGGRDCWVIRSRPAPGHDTSYGKTETWIDKKLFVALKTVFFDKKMRPLKVVLSQRIEQVSSGIWRARQQTFLSLRTKKKTIMKYERIIINARLDETIFDQRRLSQWR